MMTREMTMTPMVSGMLSPRMRSDAPPDHVVMHRLPANCQNIACSVGSPRPAIAGYSLCDRTKTEIGDISPTSTAGWQRGDIGIDQVGRRGTVISVIVDGQPLEQRLGHGCGSDVQDLNDGSIERQMKRGFCKTLL